ncbi:MAG: replicative DNA helicase [Anaerolineales bacterium]|nr:replicative DNA helicase [Anaerolineales bacterium]MDW8161710.1 replicative DNA helicase [Anaerolineales bacterium]
MASFYPSEETTAPGPLLVPHNREAEEAVLGSVLINPEAYFEVASFLRPEDFYLIRHRWIWECFTHLHETRTPIDYLTVTEELARRGQLEEVGGAAYLSYLITNVPTSLHAQAYARIVEANSIRRQMMSAANEIAKLAVKEDTTVEDLMDAAEKAIFGVSERRLERDLKTLRAVLGEYYDQLEAIVLRSEETVGIPTGFIDLDRLLVGLQPSDFIIVAGRPGMGKTAFLLSVAKYVAQVKRKHVAIFSMEMSNEQLVQRLLSQETGIDSQKLRTARLSAEEWQVLTQAIESLRNVQIFLDDTPALTPLQMRTKCRRLHLEFGLDLVLVDYLQLMSSGMRHENRVQEVSYLSRNMKILARELNVPVMVAAQLSRAVEQRADKEPQLSDLRESGSLEQDADVVIFLHRPAEYKSDPLRQNIVELKVAKHRNGPVGSLELVFREKITKFENAATRVIDLNQI